MPKPKLTEEQKAKHKAALAKHHEDGRNGKANTSAGAPRAPRAIGNVSRKISDLTEPASEIIKKAIIGGLVPEMEVWEGTPEEKAEILSKNKSAKFEIVEAEEDLFVEVLIKYVPVSKSRVEIAKWVISQDIALKKAIEESRLRKLETAMKQKIAEEKGAVAVEDQQEKAKKLAEEGKHIRPVFSVEIDEDDLEEDD